MILTVLIASTLPDALFRGGVSEGSHIVSNGSVFWLYCEVNSIASILIVTWNKDGVPMLQDVPHIRIRNYTSTYSTTFLLVVDNFQDSDTGIYQCSAQFMESIITGDALTLMLTSNA